MFGANYFGQPYFGQGYAGTTAPIVVDWGWAPIDLGGFYRLTRVDVGAVLADFPGILPAPPPPDWPSWQLVDLGGFYRRGRLDIGPVHADGIDILPPAAFTQWGWSQTEHGLFVRIRPLAQAGGEALAEALAPLGIVWGWEPITVGAFRFRRFRLADARQADGWVIIAVGRDFPHPYDVAMAVGRSFIHPFSIAGSIGGDFLHPFGILQNARDWTQRLTKPVKSRIDITRT